MPETAIAQGEAAHAPMIRETSALRRRWIATLRSR
jgi:hypothetical protein